MNSTSWSPFQRSLRRRPTPAPTPTRLHEPRFSSPFPSFSPSDSVDSLARSPANRRRMSRAVFRCALHFGRRRPLLRAGLLEARPAKLDDGQRSPLGEYPAPAVLADEFLLGHDPRLTPTQLPDRRPCPRIGELLGPIREIGDKGL